LALPPFLPPYFLLAFGSGLILIRTSLPVRAARRQVTHQDQGRIIACSWSYEGVKCFFDSCSFFSCLTARVIYQNRRKKPPLTLCWWSFWKHFFTTADPQ